MRAARKRAQDNLVQEMSEALRRSKAVPDEGWLLEPSLAKPAPPVEEQSEEVELTSEDITSSEPQPTPAAPWTAATEASSWNAGWSVGPQLGQASGGVVSPPPKAFEGEADLWRIVNAGQQAPADAGGSFEAALKQVDQHSPRSSWVLRRAPTRRKSR